MVNSNSKKHAAGLEHYKKLVASNPSVKLRGATVSYTSLNGNMFSYLGKTGEMALRLPEGAREAFLKKYKTTLCKQYGIVQREYVAVPHSLLLRTEELMRFFDLSYSYANSLTPKSGKKSG
jgi:hypothetical protein